MTALATAIGRGTLAARPAAGSPGRVYYVTDGTPTLYRDNGSSWDSIGETGTALTVQDEGTPLATAADTLNFTGAGVTASGTTGTKTINIPGGGGSSGPFPLGMPYGSLQRTYTFDTTVESWTTTGGTLSSTGSRLRLAVAGLQVALEPSTAANVADGEVQMDGRIVSGDDIDVVFRATDANNLYLMEFIHQGHAGRGVRLYKRVTGTFTLLGSAFHPTGGELPIENDGQTYKLMVRFVGSQIDAYLNNMLVGSWWDTTYTTGDVGIACGGQGSTTIDVDNVRVYSITTETQGSPGTGARV